MGKVTTKIERMENTRNKGHWYKRDRNKREGGGALLGVDGMDMRIWWLQGRSASGDDDIDHRRPQELQISSIIEK